MQVDNNGVFGYTEDEPMWEPEKTYEITLSDGSKISNLTLNGNNFVSHTKVTESMFTGKLGEVTITDSTGYHEHHENMELLQIMPYEGDWYFIIRDIPAEEMYKMRIRGDIDYLAMMGNIEL